MIKNAVALVTGGASGLGKATVKRFAENGLKVILCDLPTSEGQDVATKYGENVLFVPTDVTNEGQVEHAVQQAKDIFGRLDIAVNCAGTSCAFQTCNFNSGLKHSLGDFRRVADVNTNGAFNVICNAALLMGQNTPNEDGQRGVIVNTSATAAFEGQTGQAAFAAASAGIIGMTLPIANDLCSQGIRVVTIAPGFFETPLTGYLPEEVHQYLSEATPSPPRLGKPFEFAHLVQSIVENPLLNGVTIRLDGGLRFSM